MFALSSGLYFLQDLEIWILYILSFQENNLCNPQPPMMAEAQAVNIVTFVTFRKFYDR
jgi:hypothetical protein